MKWREDEFAVGDKVFLKVSPTKGVMRFGKKGELIAKYAGPYEILQRIGKVAYKLALPMKFEKMHENHGLLPERIQIDSNLKCEERPVKIMDRKVHSTRNKDVNIM